MKRSFVRFGSRKKIQDSPTSKTSEIFIDLSNASTRDKESLIKNLRKKFQVGRNCIRVEMADQEGISQRI